MTCSII